MSTTPTLSFHSALTQLSLCSFTGRRTVGGDEDAALKVFERLEPLTPLLLVEPAVDAQRREVALDEQLRKRLRALDRLDEDDDLGGKERERGTKQRGIGEYRHIHMLPLYMSQKRRCSATEKRQRHTPLATVSI